MRTIKFRGKRIDNGEWVYGAFYPIKSEDVYFIINNCKSIDFDDDDTTFNGYKVHKKSVGEFTGLYDINGKEFYEGDILKGKTGKNYEVGFKNGCFLAKDGSVAILGAEMEAFEVIGNIYENPELVKLQITLNGLVLRGLCAKYFQPRKTKPMLCTVNLFKIKI